MTQRLVGGAWIARELGLTAKDLAEACEAEKLIAYSALDGRQILPSHRIFSKFKYQSVPLRFRIFSDLQASIAIRESCCEHVRVFVENQDVERDRASKCCDSHTGLLGSRSPMERLVHESIESGRAFSKSLEKKVIEHNGGKYILYLRPKGLFNDSQHRMIPASMFSFQVAEESYEFEFGCLLVSDLHVLDQPVAWETKLAFRDVKSSTEIRKNVIQCCFENIEFEVDFLVYHDHPCDQYKYQNDMGYRSLYRKRITSIYNTSFDYYSCNGKNKLKHKEDFFIFNYNEYMNQHANIESDDDEFYQSVQSMLFDVEEIKKIKNIDIDKIKIFNDPVLYILDCIDIAISKILDKKAKNVLTAYKLKLEGFPNNDEIYKKVLNPSARDDIWQGRKSDVSMLFKVAPSVFENLKIPYIPWSQIKKAHTANESVKKILLSKIAENIIQQVERYNCNVNNR